MDPICIYHYCRSVCSQYFHVNAGCLHSGLLLLYPGFLWRLVSRTLFSIHTFSRWHSYARHGISRFIICIKFDWPRVRADGHWLRQ